MRKAIYIGGGIILLVVLVVVFFRPADEGRETLPITNLLSDLRTDSVSRIEVSGDDLTVTLKSGYSYVTHKESRVSLFTILADNDIEATGVIIEVDDDFNTGDWIGLILNFLPLLLFLGIIYALIRAVNKLNRQ